MIPTGQVAQYSTESFGGSNHKAIGISAWNPAQSFLPEKRCS
jgi:hypothetical protein